MCVYMYEARKHPEYERMYVVSIYACIMYILGFFFLFLLLNVRETEKKINGTFIVVLQDLSLSLSHFLFVKVC